MVQEAHVSSEVAKLLKEKGFDGDCENECHMFYHEMTDRIMPIMEIGMIPDYDDVYFAPTLQMAMAWLRKKHKLLISIDASPIYGKVKDENSRNICGILYWHYIASGEWLNDKYDANKKAFVVSGKSYEEAVEEALKYSLENLI